MITRLNRRLRIAATVIVSIAGLIGLAFLATYYYLKPTLPDVAVLRDVRLQVPLRVYSRDGRLLFGNFLIDALKYRGKAQK